MTGHAGGVRRQGLSARLGVALTLPNYRRFLGGVFVSMTATWMHAVALAWLVVERTDSGVALGIVAALQFGPILVLGPIGGLLADRFEKRRLLIVAQLCAAFVTVGLAAVDFLDRTTMPIVYASALGLGIVTAIDNPTRRAFISEMVPPAAIQNAVSLQTAATTSSRVIGPLIAGVLIGVGGSAPSFAANGASFLAFAAILQTIKPAGLSPVRTERAPRQLRDALVHAMRDRGIFVPLAMTLLISVFTWEHEVVLPLFATETFDGSAMTLAVLFAALSVGNVVGALYSATRETSHQTLRRGALVVVGGVAGTAAAPTLALALVMLAVTGGGFAVFFSTANALLQRDTPPQMRGRVLALMSMVFLGGRPIGGLIIGFIIETTGPRTALTCGALGAGAAAVLGHRVRTSTDAYPPVRTEPVRD